MHRTVALMLCSLLVAVAATAAAPLPKDPAEPKPTATLKGYTTFILSLHYSPDGLMLATGGWDETNKMPDVKNVTVRATLSEHVHTVFALVIDSNGMTLTSMSGDKPVKLWDIPAPK